MKKLLLASTAFVLFAGTSVLAADLPVKAPPLAPQPPWHGYDLGHWPRELERQAEMAVRSDYFDLGKQVVNERRSDVAMNTPIERE